MGKSDIRFIQSVGEIVIYVTDGTLQGQAALLTDEKGVYANTYANKLEVNIALRYATYDIPDYLVVFVLNYVLLSEWKYNSDLERLSLKGWILHERLPSSEKCLWYFMARPFFPAGPVITEVD